MSVLPIVRYPNPWLRLVCDPVTSFDGRLRELADNLGETMRSVRGAGLAANQVGENVQVFVVDPFVVSGRKKDGSPVVFVNPEVTLDGEEVLDAEGCLSFPGVFVNVRRSSWARVRARDIGGQEFFLEGGELFARSMQHEVDHLRGRLLVDVVGPVTRKIIEKKLRKGGR